MPRHLPLLTSLALLGLCGLADSARADDAKPAEAKITYQQHILPLFREKCGSCHNANDKKGDLVLDNYSAAIAGGASGEVIQTDGDADGSQLYRVVAHLSEPFMPPNQPKMSDEQVGLIKKWIEQGALEKAGDKAKAKKAMAVAKVESAIQRPEGPPPMPENLSIEPKILSPRANSVTALAANPWSPLIAVAGHQQVLLYHSQTQELVGVLPFPEGQPHVLKFSRNGSMLLAGGGRGAQAGLVVLFDVKTGERVAEIGAEYDVVLAADLSPDQTIVVLGGPKKIVRAYSVETGELIYESKKHTDWITAVEFSPDGVLVATGDRSNGLIVWEGATGREYSVLTGHTGAINDLSFSPDGNLLASGSEDGTIRLWEMQNGTQVKNWPGHGGGVQSLKFARDGRILSTGRDRVTRQWDGNGGKQKEFPALPDVGMKVAVDVDANLVLAGDLTGAVQVWRAGDATVAGTLVTNPLNVDGRLATLQPLVQQTTAAHQQAVAKRAAVEKGIADRKAAADAAAQKATTLQTQLNEATAARAALDADRNTKQAAVPVAEKAVTDAKAAQANAVAAEQVAAKLVQESAAQVESLAKNVSTAEAAAQQSAQASAEKPDDAALKQAAEQATQAVASAKAAHETAAKQLAERQAQQTAKATEAQKANEAVGAATAAHIAAAKATETATAALATHDKNLKGLTDALNAAKAEGEKLAKAAPATPDEQKALDAAAAEVKQAEEKLAVLQQQAERLKQAQQRVTASK